MLLLHSNLILVFIYNRDKGYSCIYIAFLSFYWKDKQLARKQNKRGKQEKRGPIRVKQCVGKYQMVPNFEGWG